MLALSNQDKVLYPATGFTKAEVIDYYTRISPVLLPHLADRPLTLKRYPNGVDQPFFYEKRAPKHRPDWVKTFAIWSEGNDDFIDFVLCNDLPTLVWAANLADLELHTNLHYGRGEKVKTRDWLKPTMMVFDLDPGPPADIVLCCQVALWIREMFAGLKLDAYPKTSGSKGMQLYVPLNTPEATYEQTKEFCHEVARRLEKEHPGEVVSMMKKSLRDGKIFLDWSQNDDNKTTVNVYSLRAKEEPTVSTPIAWEEVAACLAARDAQNLVFKTEDVLARVEKSGDLFAKVLTQEQKLPPL